VRRKARELLQKSNDFEGMVGSFRKKTFLKKSASGALTGRWASRSIRIGAVPLSGASQRSIDGPLGQPLDIVFH
jgi:hypothetical protein